jgi:protein-S-isoprenylcysteine O-methyltransferase Ste14
MAGNTHGSGTVKRRALIVVPLVIAILGTIFALVGYVVGSVLHIPNSIHMPAGLRATGGVVLVFGFVFMGWVFRYRSPVDMLTSTYVTMRKGVGGARAQEALTRAEPLILEGPQRYVRHPLYFAVVVILAGWWLLLDCTIIMFMALLFLAWFTFVVTRFEEQELRTLFGEQYETYARAVPRIMPSFRPRWD